MAIADYYDGLDKLAEDHGGTDFVKISPSQAASFFTNTTMWYRETLLGEKQIIEKGLNPDDFRDYISFFKFGCPPHGGAGIGPGRIVMQILNLPSIKEATFLPRDVKRLTP